ncbi:MAG: sensor histidine kinase [Bdellovibrionales bacterium]
MRLKLGYVLLFCSLLALVGQVVTNLNRERRFFELQLLTRADSIEAGLREKWRAHLLDLARGQRLEKSFALKWDRSTRAPRSVFFPVHAVELDWESYRRAAAAGDRRSQRAFLEKSLQRFQSWDRVLALEEWSRHFPDESLPAALRNIPTIGYERTLGNREARIAFGLIFKAVESGAEFPKGEGQVELRSAFFEMTDIDTVEAYLPSIASVKTKTGILKGFLKENGLESADFGLSSLDIRFPQIVRLASHNSAGADTVLFALSAFFVVTGLILTGSGLRAERTRIAKRVSFLNQLVHELKTPLTGLKLNTQLILRGEAQADNLHAIMECVARMDQLFEDIVRINRPQTPARAENLSAEAVNRVLAEVCAEWSPRQVEIVSAASQAIVAEPVRLRVILRNLISNGLKFGDDVKLRVREDTQLTRIEVGDQGPGVDGRDAKKIFNEFFRGGRGMSRNVDGLGLGLALARKLAREMGAEVELLNPGEPGAVFAVNVRRAQGSEII